jgi:hypothetical protein
LEPLLDDSFSTIKFLIDIRYSINGGETGGMGPP